MAPTTPSTCPRAKDHLRVHRKRPLRRQFQLLGNLTARSENGRLRDGLQSALGSSNYATGRFTWLDDNVVELQPDGLWPAHAKVSVTAGGAKTNFETGAAVVGIVDISAHTLTVKIDEQVVREMPASMGKSRFPTPTGTFSVLAKERTVVMDSRTIGIPLSDPEGYRLTVDYAVRITGSGVYVHSAPWSVGSQGYANVSHGCINLSPANAAWYFNTVGVGDPLIWHADDGRQRCSRRRRGT